MSDLTTMIIDLLRKKQEEEAVHAGEGQPSPEQALALLKAQSTPMQPDPGMLGSGLAQKGGELLKDRKSQIEAALAAASQ